MTVKEKINEFAENLSADSVSRGDKWEGHDVYIPVYNKPSFVGLPLIIFVDGEDVRLSTPDEALEYLSATAPQEREIDDLAQLYDIKE